MRAAFDRQALRFAGSVAGLAEPTAFAAFLARCRTTDWVVYAKPPFAGPAQVLEYLGRYTHRVAISNDRLLSVDDGQVRFRWTDYAHGKRLKTMTLSADEFLRRFLLHILPDRFVRIRHFGFLANRGRHGQARPVSAAPGGAPGATPGPARAGGGPRAPADRRGHHPCPVCRAGRLRIVAVFRPGARPVPVVDTS